MAQDTQTMQTKMDGKPVKVESKAPRPLTTLPRPGLQPRRPTPIPPAGQAVVR